MSTRISPKTRIENEDPLAHNYLFNFGFNFLTNKASLILVTYSVTHFVLISAKFRCSRARVPKCRELMPHRTNSYHTNIKIDLRHWSLE